MKILCLFVRHGTEKYPDALTVLDQWYESHGLMDQRTLWIIDNALYPGHPSQALGPRTVLRPGNNRAWEFSAWEQVLQESGDNLLDYDVVHFVTSAFNTLYVRYLAHFHANMLAEVATHNFCLGHIDGYNQPVEIAGSFSQSWIRTCFFFLPSTVARAIRPWTAFADPFSVFSSPEDTRFRAEAPLSGDYQARIRTWLEGHEVGGHTWHSPIRNGQAEAERFQRKTLAILNEHKFSITLRSFHVPLVDFCWLFSLKNHRVACLSTAIPGDLEQLKVRRRILGIPEASCL